MRKQAINKEIQRAKVLRLLRMSGQWLLMCFTCGRRKAVKEAEIDEESFKYVDKDRAKNKAKSFLIGLAKKENIELKIKMDFRHMESVSLYLFPVNNCFRSFLFRLTESKFFEYFIILVIALSAI